ncbi:MAG TPA: DUF3108 domain-containing protein [Stellaceae bacterium]|nr:DUF3108 domain-containing protein [Stellaceae bacterium]
MISAVGLPVLRGVWLVLLALAAFSPPALADQRVATRFEVFGFAGVRVLTLQNRTEEMGDRYAITTDYATKGVASVFIDLTTHAEVHGRLVTGSAQPEQFRNDSRRNGAERHSRLDYRPDGTVEGGSTPALPQPVPAAATRGSVDNLTAYLRLERQLARTGSCALTVRVFDGRHAYDLIFADAGREVLSPAGGQHFSGNAIACHMTRRSWPNVPDAEKDEGARQGTIWYARLIPGDLLVPVRMQMDTQLGVVEGYLAELHGEGVDLTLME